MTTNDSSQPKPGSNLRRGFAALDPARRSAIAREGGRAAHEKGTAHQFTPEEARAAGIRSREARRNRMSEQLQADVAASRAGQDSQHAHPGQAQMHAQDKGTKDAQQH